MTTVWKSFTNRTDDPKLAYIERMLTEKGIPHKRTGWSFHAPILSVPADRLDEAWQLLGRDWDENPRTGRMESLDDADDDDPVFAEQFYQSPPHDFDGETETKPLVGD